MNERMKKLSDAEAYEYVRSDECSVMDLWSAHEETFKAGFDAAHDLLMKDVSVLIERLDAFLECHGISQDTPIVLRRLKDALAELRKMMGE